MHVLSLPRFICPKTRWTWFHGTGAFLKTAEDSPLKEEERVMIISPVKVLHKFVPASWPTMAVNLSKNGPALTDAYNEVVNGRTSTDW